ncbi:MAG: type II toxin-antitoxin system RelE/ParE family toxin [Actinomycetota bacterium]
MTDQVRRRWRDYRTAAGRRLVNEFITKLSLDDQAEVAAAMQDVRENGLVVARHLRGDIYEVRATGIQEEFRILFATEGARSQVLLSLEAFSKKSRKTPPPKIALAERRLADWRRRSRKG